MILLYFEVLRKLVKVKLLEVLLRTGYSISFIIGFINYSPSLVFTKLFQLFLSLHIPQRLYAAVLNEGDTSKIRRIPEKKQEINEINYHVW